MGINLLFSIFIEKFSDDRMGPTRPEQRLPFPRLIPSTTGSIGQQPVGKGEVIRLSISHITILPAEQIDNDLWVFMIRPPFRAADRQRSAELLLNDAIIFAEHEKTTKVIFRPQTVVIVQRYPTAIEQMGISIKL